MATKWLSTEVDAELMITVVLDEACKAVNSNTALDVSFPSRSGSRDCRNVLLQILHCVVFEHPPSDQIY